MPSVLILGATSDVARPLLELYAADGFDVHLAARDRERAGELAREIEARHGVRATAIRFEAGDLESHAPLVAELEPLPTGVVCLVGQLGDEGGWLAGRPRGGRA